MAWHAIDAIHPGFDKTLAFFSGPNLFWKWVKIGILVFIFSMLSGGGGGSPNLNLPANEGFASADEAFSAMSAWLASIPQQTINLIMVWAVVAIVLLFIIGVLLTLLKNMCFFAILESASTNKVKIIAYLKKFYRKAVSLTLFEVVLGLISLPFMLILLLAGISFLLAITGIGTAVLGPLSGITSNFPLMAALALASLLALLVLGIAGFILGQFAAYWMYLTNMGSREAFGKSLALVKSNIGQVILLIVMQMVLGIVAAIISIVALLLIAIPFAIVGILLALVLIPMIALSPAVLL